jgi:hypothetical protein
MAMLAVAVLGWTTLLHLQEAAAQTYCPNPAHAKPDKVPLDLITAIAKAFQIDNAAAASGAVVRCVGARLMACYVGANLNCNKADTRRVLPGASAWCRQNPGAASVPMVATGHDTIYEWSCQGSRAVAGRPAVTVDRQGFIAENWKEIR